ncbi:MAG: glutathione-regulated potassium-efflux system ancillary protein KefG [Candidatus Promineifilaceae bacterium]|jgi:glutathione-regulated potassium-efflux system ancillary protein KefG
MSTSNKILILFAHPMPHKSRVNRRLIKAARRLDGVTVHDLYECYPEFDMDVAHEQALLQAHDIIILHHPSTGTASPRF